MNKYYILKWDKKKNKIVTDRPTKDDEEDRGCRVYCFYNGNDDTEGYGCIARSRDVCCRKLIKCIKDDMKAYSKTMMKYQEAIDMLEQRRQIIIDEFITDKCEEGKDEY